MAGIKETMGIMYEMVGKGKRVFEKKEFLDNVNQINPYIANQIEEAVNGMKNLRFEVLGKANANYNIAIVRIKSGKKVVGSASASVTYGDFTRAPELKSSLHLPNGTQSRGKSIENGKFMVETIRNGRTAEQLYDISDGELLYTKNHLQKKK